jgi:type II secretion system protein G
MMIPTRLKLSPEELKARQDEKLSLRRRRRHAVKQAAGVKVSGWFSFTRSPRYLGVLVVGFVLLGILLATQAGRSRMTGGRRLTIQEWFTGPVARGEITSPIQRVNENLGSLRTALELFHKDCGRYPSTRENLAALIRQPRSAPGWHGPYIKALWPDPWKHPYHYEIAGGILRLSSNGPDGQMNTGDDIFAPPPDMTLVNQLRPPAAANLSDAAGTP